MYVLCLCDRNGSCLVGVMHPHVELIPSIEVKLPPEKIVRPKDLLCVPGKGLPCHSREGHGDLFAEVSFDLSRRALALEVVFFLALRHNLTPAVDTQLAV